VAGFAPTVVIKAPDLVSLITLVSAGIGQAPLPGHVRGMCGDQLTLVSLKPTYRMRRSIALSFLRVRECDPKLLALAAVCRMLKHGAAARE
jgi:LysR family malonate utilization transcriptional regulator